MRYGAGSGFFRMLMAPHVGGNAPGAIKLVQGIGLMLRQPIRALQSYLVPDWAKYTIILLFMRTAEGTLRFRLRGLPVEGAELTMKPKTLLSLDDKTTISVLNLIENLEDLDDVTSVYSNLEISESVLRSLEE